MVKDKDEPKVETKEEKAPDWRDPEQKFADDDTSLDAEMRRLSEQESVQS